MYTPGGINRQGPEGRYLYPAPTYLSVGDFPRLRLSLVMTLNGVAIDPAALLIGVGVVPICHRAAMYVRNELCNELCHRAHRRGEYNGRNRRTESVGVDPCKGTGTE